MVTILIMSAKIPTPGLSKIKVLWKESYDVIISVNDVTNKTLSCDSNHIVYVAMWPKFGSTMREFISMGEFIITWRFNGIEQKNRFFWGVVFVQVQ